MNHEQPTEVQAFCDAVLTGNVSRTRELLASEHVRAQVNEPIFAFGQRAAHMAAKNIDLLTALIDAGADVNRKSDWENGPYTVLDNANEDSARFLLTRGAMLTPNVAARLGWFDELQRLIDADGALVHARGGDGQQPLHEAKTVAIADFLLNRGAGIDVRCIDHTSTPAQYALVDRPQVCRRLLERGATPDIFMAAHLGDVPLVTRALDADPSCVQARIHEPGYDLVPPLSIYCWSLGFGLSPHDVAKRQAHHDVYELLMTRSPAPVRFLNAVMAADEAHANDLLAKEPSLLSSLTSEGHSHLAQAIFHGHFAAAEIMLRLGFDPAAPGVDGGTALHAACWVGHVHMVERLIARGGVPIDARDPTHHSTPLGWAAFGSVHRKAAGADYPGVVDRLVAAGADITAPGNGEGRTLLEMAQGNSVLQAALRRYGAS
jgi:ankyrin repeat protein